MVVKKIYLLMKKLIKYLKMITDSNLFKMYGVMVKLLKSLY